MKPPTILLINPWIHDFAAYDLWSAPMGLLVLATRLKTAGAAPLLFDFLDTGHLKDIPVKRSDHGHGRFHREAIEKPSRLGHVPRVFSRYGAPKDRAHDLLSELPQPAAILVTGMMTYWYTGVSETIAVLREVFPKAPIILGGIYATLTPEHAVANSGADMVMPGLGERRIVHILERIVGFSPNGLSHKTYEFEPSLELIKSVGFLPLLTSRGCPFRCAYCASHIIAGKYHRRGIPDVVSEINRAVENYNIRDVALYDDAFLMGPEPGPLDLLDKVGRMRDDLRWHSPNGLHCAQIDRGIAGAMKRAGFETIRLGFESASDAFHTGSGGKTTVSAFFRAVANLRDAGFARKQIGAYILAGLPNQTAPEIEDAVEKAIDAGATPKLSEFSPIPGSKMWPEAVRKSKYPIDKEPLFHNCTLLAAAEEGVDRDFLSRTRRRIRDRLT